MTAGAPKSRLPEALLIAALVACGAWFAFRVVRGLPNPVSGDFEHFYHAAKAMTRGADIYASHTRGYIYPPLVAALFSPLALLERYWAEVAWVSLSALLTALSIAALYRIILERFRIEHHRLTFLAITTAAVLLTFDQIRWEFEEGQTDTIILLGLSLALWFLDRRPLLAGLALGLAVNVKYHSLIVLPYLLIRGRYRAAAGMIGGILFWAAVPAIACGWERNLAYLATAGRGVLRLLGVETPGAGVQPHDIRWEASISLPSAVARQLGTDASGMLIMGVVCGVALLVLGGAWLIFRRRGVPLWAGRGGEAESERAPVVALEWCGLVVAMLAFSPQAMVRHTFLLLMVHMIAAAIVLTRRPGVAVGVLVAGLALLQIGTRFPPGNVEFFEPSLRAWRSIGGASWCMIAMYFSLLWVGLRHAGAVPSGEKASELAPSPALPRLPGLPEAGA